MVKRTIRVMILMMNTKVQILLKKLRAMMNFNNWKARNFKSRILLPNLKLFSTKATKINNKLRA